jgi:excisionase family DNA binding protein
LTTELEPDKQSTVDPYVVSVTEAAELLGISKDLAYDLARRGELPGAIHLGRRWRVSLVRLRQALHGPPGRRCPVGRPPRGHGLPGHEGLRDVNYQLKTTWRDARVAESDGLENRCGCTPTVGSNPTPSALWGLWRREAGPLLHQTLSACPLVDRALAPDGH